MDRAMGEMANEWTKTGNGQTEGRGTDGRTDGRKTNIYITSTVTCNAEP